MSVWQVEYTVEDEKGGVARVRAYLPRRPFAEITAPADDPVAFAAALAQALDPYLGGRIARLHLGTQLALPAGLKALPDSDSDVEAGAMVLYRTGAGNLFGHRLPTFRSEFFQPGGEAVAWAPGFPELMTDPGALPAGWTVRPSDRRGDPLAAILSARAHFLPR